MLETENPHIRSLLIEMDNQAEDENYHHLIGLPEYLANVVRMLSNDEVAEEFVTYIYDHGGLLNIIESL